jgi:hypothetical protein
VQRIKRRDNRQGVIEIRESDGIVSQRPSHGQEIYVDSRWREDHIQKQIAQQYMENTVEDAKSGRPIYLRRPENGGAGMRRLLIRLQQERRGLANVCYTQGGLRIGGKGPLAMIERDCNNESHNRSMDDYIECGLRHSGRLDGIRMAVTDRNPALTAATCEYIELMRIRRVLLSRGGDQIIVTSSNACLQQSEKRTQKTMDHRDKKRTKLWRKKDMYTTATWK